MASATFYNGFTLQLDCVEAGTEPVNNRSLMYYHLYIIKSTNRYPWVSNSHPWSVHINGANVANGSWSYNFSGIGVGGSVTLCEGYAWVGHDANGAGSAFHEAWVEGETPLTANDGDTVYCSGYAPMTDFYRGPVNTAMGTITRASNGLSATIPWSGGVSNNGPGVTFYLQRSTDGTNFSGIQSSTAYSGTFTDSGISATTDYYYRIYSANSDGSQYTVPSPAWAPPLFTGFTLPQGVLGKSYSGQVTGTRVTTFGIKSGSGTLPTGLTMSTSGVISGTPTAPGAFSFVVSATNNWGTQYSATQSIFVAAGGPWVKTASAVVNATINNVAVSAGTATITTSAAHNIAQVNQPITISGLTGSAAALNGQQTVLSYTSNTFTFATTSGNIASTSASGTAVSNWKRSTLYVRQGGQWVAAYLRVYQAATSSWVYIK